MGEDSGRTVARLLDDGLDRLGISVAPQACAQLVFYCLELRKWSAKVNLVARNTSLQDLVEKHFLDSLLLLPLLDSRCGQDPTLLDIGSGAGFPGLVVKIARPAIKTLLLEPRQRRTAFLRHIIRTLALEDVEAMAARTDEIQAGRFHFSIITGRAVADIPLFLRMAAPLCAPQTLVICMQGTAGRQNLGPGHSVGGFSCISLREGVLPFSGDPRFLLLFSRTDALTA